MWANISEGACVSGVWESSPTIEMMQRALRIVNADLVLDDEYFRFMLDPIDIFAISVSLHCRIISEGCRGMLRSYSRANVVDGVAALLCLWRDMENLVDFITEIDPNAAPSSGIWRGIFDDVFKIQETLMEEKLESWIGRAVRRETWSPIGDGGNDGDPVLHSISVDDMFFMLSQTIPLEMEYQSLQTLYSVVCKCLLLYCEALERMCTDEIDQLLAEHRKGRDVGAADEISHIADEFWTRLNNIYIAYDDRLSSLATRLAGGVDAHTDTVLTTLNDETDANEASDLFDDVEHEMRRIHHRIVDKYATIVENKIMQMIITIISAASAENEPSWAPLADYLDQTLAKPSDILYPALFQNILSTLFASSCRILESILVGEIDAHIVLSSSAATEWTLAAVKKAVDAFSEYFEADGYGISSSTVDRLVSLSSSADI